MRCKDCKHVKHKKSGAITYSYWCGISKGADGNKLGVYPWINKPHPKCPLKESEVEK
jgi:hypothetical protein